MEPSAGGDADELDALIAEAEGAEAGANATTNVATSRKADERENDFADEEAAMQEMEGLW
jgi:hypothetical protein